MNPLHSDIALRLPHFRLLIVNVVSLLAKLGKPFVTTAAVHEQLPELNRSNVEHHHAND